MAHLTRVPSFVYHGTSLSAWEEIQKDNAMFPGVETADRAVCFSTSSLVGEYFAIHAATRIDDDEAVILVISTAALEKRGLRFEPYDDARICNDGGWILTDEREVRIQCDQLDDIISLIHETYTISPRSLPSVEDALIRKGLAKAPEEFVTC